MSEQITAPETETAPTEPQTEAPAGLRSFEEEVAEALAAANDNNQAPAPSEEPNPEADPAAETEAKADGTEQAKGEEPKPEEPKPEDKLGRRLAMVAKGNRDLEVRAKELEAIEARLKPDLERIERIKTAKSRPAMLREMLGGDDEIRALFVELNDYILGADADPAPADPAADLDAKIEAKVQARLAAADKARIDAAQAEIARAKGLYVQEVQQTLEARGDQFPLCFAAPPSDKAITDISDAILESTGDVPSVETVLEMIEGHRRERIEGKKPKAAQTTPATSPAAPQANKTSGKQTSTPIRRNNVPVTPSRPLSFEEEVEAALRQAT